VGFEELRVEALGVKRERERERDGFLVLQA